MSNSRSFTEQEERAIFRAVAAGNATIDEFNLLQAKLLEDAELRARFVMSMDLEACLYEEMSSPQRVTPLPVTTLKKHPLWILLAFSVACLLIGASTALWLERSAVPIGLERDPNQLAGKESGTEFQASLIESEPAGENETVKPGFSYEATQQTPPPEIAIVTYLDAGDGHTKLKGIKIGDRLRPGLITWPQGTLHLDFLNGAQIVVSGPAQLQIHSLSLVTLLEGNAAARIPPSAKGFVMNAPDVAIVDLGTEFSVRVNENGESDVNVTDGEVVVSLLGNDGNTLRSERVSQSGSVRVTRNKTTLGPVTPAIQPTARIPDRPTPPLIVTEDYVQAVRSAQPFAYWRFEQFVNQSVPNEIGENLKLVLHAEENDNSVSVDGGMGRFRASPQSRYFSVNEGLPGWNAESFSIELWACSQRLNWMTLVDVLSEDWEGDLNAIEIAFQSPFIHTPGALRFFHRYPPAQDLHSGVNLFSQDTFTPGQWHHVVVTKTPDSLSMFVNGRELSRFEGEIECDDELYQLSVGQMDQRLHRQFEGALDEIALYSRALTTQEIKRHYELISKPAP